MPVEALPRPAGARRCVLGLVSAVFDNIPLTKMALDQGGYDAALLAYAVGVGGSMVWFGSSAGVAVSGLFPEARSDRRVARRPAGTCRSAFVAGFFALLRRARLAPLVRTPADSLLSASVRGALRSSHARAPGTRPRARDCRRLRARGAPRARRIDRRRVASRRLRTGPGAGDVADPPAPPDHPCTPGQDQTCNDDPTISVALGHLRDVGPVCLLRRPLRQPGDGALPPGETPAPRPPTIPGRQPALRHQRLRAAPGDRMHAPDHQRLEDPRDVIGGLAMTMCHFPTAQVLRVELVSGCPTVLQSGYGPRPDSAGRGRGRRRLPSDALLDVAARLRLRRGMRLL